MQLKHVYRFPLNCYAVYRWIFCHEFKAERFFCSYHHESCILRSGWNHEVRLKPRTEDLSDHYNSGATKHCGTACSDKEKLHKKFPAPGNYYVKWIYGGPSVATEAIVMVDRHLYKHQPMS